MRLDIGSGTKIEPGFEGLDVQNLPGVTHVWDINSHPWPFEDGSVNEARCFHLIEHIPPVAIENGKTWFPFIAFMDEVWRVLRPCALFTIEVPAGDSEGFVLDPTHCNPCNERTWGYFCRDNFFYDAYQPKPWDMVTVERNKDNNIRVVLAKI